jgi:hypothetical protein
MYNKNGILILTAIIVIIIVVFIFKWLSKKEKYLNYDFLYPKPIPRQLTGSLQYAMIYPDAIENHNFPPSIEGCTEFCKKLNNGIIDTAICMDSCMHTSGYIPRLDMLTDKQELVMNL